MKAIEQPLVTFIIPVFNSERDIARCLLSIRNQKFFEGTCEVLIMDNGSTDQTHQILRDLGFDFEVMPKIHVSALRNRGAAIAHGTYLAFVDSDVELTLHWLQNGLSGFKDRTVVASGCFPGIPTGATWVQRTWDIHQRPPWRRVSSALVPWLPSMNLIVRRDTFLAVGGFNEALETAEDVDLCYRLGRRGTILCNPAMEAIHWGEARDLRAFWRKEVWRGMGNLKGIFSHGFRWDEVPSLGYPLYILCVTLGFVLGLGVDLGRRETLLTPIGLSLLGLPASILALKTALIAQRPAAIPRLCLLYLVYGLARAFSVVKVWAASLA
jgi:glycosyltransferase involved in cell wall biosynthesis